MFRRLIVRWADGKMQKEADHCLLHLKASDRQELGFQLAGSTNARHELHELWGWDLLRPRDLIERDPLAPAKVIKLIEQLQQRGNLIDAASLMIWAHTLRASPIQATSQLKLTVRSIWEQLHLGDSYVERAALGALSLMRRRLDTGGYEETPDGFTPDRHPRLGALSAQHSSEVVDAHLKRILFLMEFLQRHLNRDRASVVQALNQDLLLSIPPDLRDPEDRIYPDPEDESIAISFRCGDHEHRSRVDQFMINGYEDIAGALVIGTAHDPSDNRQATWSFSEETQLAPAAAELGKRFWSSPGWKLSDVTIGRYRVRRLSKE